VCLAHADAGARSARHATITTDGRTNAHHLRRHGASREVSRYHIKDRCVTSVQWRASFHRLNFAPRSRSSWVLASAEAARRNDTPFTSMLRSWLPTVSSADGNQVRS
jgi:hypothetical protein